MTTLPATQTVEVLPARLEELAEKARQRLANSRAANTISAYRSDMAHFTAWCDAHGLPSLPTNSDVLVLYLFDHEDTLRPSTLSRRLSAIQRIHDVNGHPTPITGTVREALSSVKRAKGERQRQAGALFTADLTAAVSTLGDHPRDVRNKALLLLGFAGGFRRSELAALTVEDITDTPDGIRVLIAKSKTDQTGQGMHKKIHYGENEATCPVRALRAWLKVAGISAGALFRGVTHSGRIGEDALATKTINRVVKQAATAAGLDADQFSAHSLRRGHASQAITNGARDVDVMQTTGWKSIGMVRTYYADVEPFAETDSSAMLGL